MTPRVSIVILKRIAARTSFGDCWEWQGSTTEGYGTITLERREKEYIHRLIHRLFVGPIPPGYEVDHTCFNRVCWRPRHLEAVTKAENLRRGRERNGMNIPLDAGRRGSAIASANRRAISACPRGHRYNTVNTYTDKRGTRHCRACARERYYERKAS